MVNQQKRWTTSTPVWVGTDRMDAGTIWTILGLFVSLVTERSQMNNEPLVSLPRNANQLSDSQIIALGEAGVNWLTVLDAVDGNSESILLVENALLRLAIRKMEGYAFRYQYRFDSFMRGLVETVATEKPDNTYVEVAFGRKIAR